MTPPFGYNLKIVVQNWRFSASYLMDCRRSARASKKIFARVEIQLQSCCRVFHLMLIKSAISYKHGREGRLPPKILIYAQCLCKKPTKFPWNLELIQLKWQVPWIYYRDSTAVEERTSRAYPSGRIKLQRTAMLRKSATSSCSTRQSYQLWKEIFLWLKTGTYTDFSSET